MKKFGLYVLIPLFLVFTFSGCDFVSDENSDASAGNDTARGIFTMTDAPSDDLSVLQVELTEMKIKDTLDNETVIFTEVEGETFILNLLDLQGVNELLGTVPLEPAIYKEINLSYKNATALDNDGNQLTILPQHFGDIKMLLNPYVSVSEENVYFQIDFDVNNSVSNIVKGKKGHLMLMPTLIVKINDYEDGDCQLDEFKGEVISVDSMSLVVMFNDNELTVNLTDSTVVEVDEVIMNPTYPNFDLTTLIFPGNLVEIKGTLDAATNTVTATSIERKFEDEGYEYKGIITAIGESTFDLMVQDAGESGLEIGSIQTVTIDENTFIYFCDPYAPATQEMLALGQRAKVLSAAADIALAEKVKLCETKLKGTVASISPDLNQITMNVECICGVAVENIEGFVNPVTVEFEGEFPAEAVVDDEIKVEGHFNRVTIGIFTAMDFDLINEDDDDEEGDGSHGTVVGKTYSLVSSSPLIITITRGNGGGNVDGRTITVEVTGDTDLIERQQTGNSTKSITQEEFIDGVSNNTYWKLKADGTYNESGTLIAEKIIADIKKK
jgi:hypothetical protein